MTRVAQPPGALFEAARSGDRLALARLLTLVERSGGAGREVAALAYSVGSEPATVGITGAPGAGKSTLTDRLVALARSSTEASVGVLAVDPSSPFSGGAILGDRVRMQGHALDDGVFIRSMATRGQLGGLAVAVPEAVRVLGAAGFGMVFVETVGVGQVEVEVASATDTTVVVVNPGWGDAVQASKAGLLEVADVFVVNKADRPGARETRRDLEQMLDLGPGGAWRPPVVETSASNGEGLQELFGEIERHREFLGSEGRLETRRRLRAERELMKVLGARVEERVTKILGSPEHAGLLAELAAGRIDPYGAAQQLLEEALIRGPGGEDDRSR